MDLYIYCIFSIIALLASTVGAICGIGGGILIKPLLDVFGVLSVSSISFLSGCTVLSMSSYSVIKSKINKEAYVENSTGIPLAIGASIGGLFGKTLFQIIIKYSTNKELVGSIQSICLLIITLISLIYILKKDSIKTFKISSKFICMLIGFSLGVLSSFLGIGGGPINLVVLHYFFSMETKVAAQNSIYIILYSQIVSLLTTLISNNIPEFSIILLILMVIAGLVGGIYGRKISQQISDKTINKLFVFVMCFIMIICIINFINFI